MDKDKDQEIKHLLNTINQDDNYKEYIWFKRAATMAALLL
jgi:hypothetical protein